MMDDDYDEDDFDDYGEEDFDQESMGGDSVVNPFPAGGAPLYKISKPLIQFTPAGSRLPPFISISLSLFVSIMPSRLLLRNTHSN
jgi:hypothetical protein